MAILSLAQANEAAGQRNTWNIASECRYCESPVLWDFPSKNARETATAAIKQSGAIRRPFDLVPVLVDENGDEVPLPENVKTVEYRRTTAFHSCDEYQQVRQAQSKS